MASLPPTYPTDNRELGSPPARAAAPQRAYAPRADANDAGSDAELARVRTLARWLDTIPIDPLIGLVAPGVGDVIGSVFGLYVVGVAARRGLPPIVLARMLMNLAADTMIGVVPLLGDLGDLAFKANRKNVALLEARAPERRATWRDWAIVLGAALTLVVAVALAAWLTISLVRWIF